MQELVHYSLHLILPLPIAIVFFKNKKSAYLILLMTMLVDLDHLLVEPIFQADRCSIEFHVLHRFYAIPFYFVLLLLKPPFRIIGIGLLLHMLTDFIDCLWMFQECNSCYELNPLYKVLKYVSDLLGLN